jgi:serine/threonine protein kinase
MPATVSVQQMCAMLVKNRLMPVDDARAVFQLWQSEAKAVDDSEQFRKYLVDRKHLTEYQASLLAHGRTEGYYIDEYKILNRIGQGRMAGVYEAVSSAGRRVAIKVLPPSKARNPQLLARFEREARMALKLDHPNVVRTFDVGEYNGLHYMVMECLEGETFDEVISRKKRLPVAEAVRIVYEALLGLQHIHERGMIHRDMKPANLMLAPTAGAEFRVRILDIGLGRTLFDDSAEAEKQETQITQEGVLLGTPDYLAPEQARDARSVDIRADIYSLGCVLYHALAGQPPFPDANMLSQVIRHATEPVQPLREFNAEAPDGLQQVLNFMMAKDANQRYPTPERAAKALQIFLPLEPPAPLPPEGTPAVKQEPKPTSSQPAAKPAGEIPVGRIVSAKAEKAPAAPPKKEEVKPVVAKKDEPKVAAVQGAPAVEYDVELVAIPCPPPVMPKKPADQRSLLDMDRRDFIMFGGGIASALLTILATVGLVRLVRRKPNDSAKPEENKP